MKIATTFVSATLVILLPLGIVVGAAESASAHAITTPSISGGIVGASNSGVDPTTGVTQYDGGTADSSSEVKNAQARYANSANKADYAKAVALYDQLLERRGAPDTSTALTPATGTKVVYSMCVTIYRWELEAYAWYLIVAGGTVAAVGGFIDFSGVGIPVGAILNAIGIGTGIGGSALLAWVDSHFPTSRAYCIRW